MLFFLSYPSQRGGWWSRRSHDHVSTRFPRYNPPTCSLTARQIKLLSELDQDQLVQCVDNQLKAFTDLLGKPSKQIQLSQPDIMETVLQILSKLAREAQNPESELQGTASKVLAEILSERCTYFHHHLRVSYIANLRLPQSRGRGLMTTDRTGTTKAQNLCHLFHTILTALPRASWSCLPVDELYEAVSKGTMCHVSTTIVSEAEDLVKQRNEIKESHQRQKQAERLKGEEPKEEWDNSEYRQLPILPTWEEVCAIGRPAQLRKNIVNESNYNDWMHYYDIQFRLLREDLVGPLRRGISEYRQGIRGRQLTDVKDYDYVTIIQPKCTQNGVCFDVRFDITRFARYKWEHSKRLIFGSLVCLSSDNFEDVILFATIADRKPELLCCGQIMLQFEDPISALPYCKKKTSFVMVESSAYFEASRHILRSLQVAEIDTMPFTSYLIKGECTTISPPRYLQGGSAPVYDLSCLYGSDTKKDLEFNVLDESIWEITAKSAEIQLDPSQLKAIKTSLTQEISVIQGPPGTGKTYIGLKIVEALLTNRRVWDRLGVSPILVMCYTNHALDQFLEGILQLNCCQRGWLGRLLQQQQPRLVRIGGRSQSEAVSKFNIGNVLRNNRLQPKHEYEHKRNLKAALGRPLPEAAWRAMKSYSDPSCFRLLTLGQVRNVAHPDHYYQLFQNDVPQNPEDLQLDVWLGLWESVEEPQHQSHEQQPNKASQKSSVSVLKQEQATGLTKPPGAFITRSSDDNSVNNDNSSEETASSEEDEDSSFKPNQKAPNPSEDVPQQDGVELVAVEGEAAIEAAARMSSEAAEDFKVIPCDEELVEEVLVGKRYSNSEEREREPRKKKEDLEDEPMSEQGHSHDVDAADIGGSSDESEDSSEQDTGTAELVKNKLPPPAQRTQPKRRAQPKRRWVCREDAIRIIQRNIYKSAMSEDRVSKVQDINQLTPRDRWRLYNYWAKKHCKLLERKNELVFEEYDDLCQQYKEANQQSHRYALESADVIGMTTTGAAKYQHILHMVKPKIVIVEEAAEVLEAHIVSALSAGTQHLILIGDHKQLRPKPNEYELAKKYNLEVSLFERLLRKGLHHETLQIQHRMRPEIARLVHPHIYDTLINHTSVEQYGTVKGVRKNMFFVHHESPEKQDSNLSHANEYEADYIVALCRYLLQQGYKSTQITILTPYTGQLLVIRNRMPKNEFGALRITAVDNFQGEENDIILLSLVRSSKEGKIGFLSEENRVCVSLSRAKVGFYCVGNFSLLRAKSSLWERIMSDMDQHDYLGDALPLQCQNHPDTLLQAKHPGDFKKYTPNGGCLRPCETRLPCGHVCVGLCHPSHENYTCVKRCERKCKEGHEFPHHRCCDKCPRCYVLVEKTMPECGHMQEMKCHRDPSLVQCCAPCSLVCSQGQHQCNKLCHEQCAPECMEMVSIVIPSCGHEQLIPCHKNPMLVSCNTEVEKEIPQCHHKHKMPCHKDPKYVLCSTKLEKVLPRCLHKHIMPCHQDPLSFSCNLPCERKCPTDHHQCNKLCYEDCDTECMEMVPKAIPSCGHEHLMPCHQDPMLVPCGTKVEKELPQCQHKHIMPCHKDPKLVLCGTKVEKELPQCHHKHTMPCHQDPSSFKCKLPCERVCPNGHQCMKLCCKDCSSCHIPVERVLRKCQHKALMQCNTNPEQFVCSELCSKSLSCGQHKCPRTCGESCPHKCNHKVVTTLPCGHINTLRCWMTKDYLTSSKACKHTCKKKLPCGHLCTRPCGNPCTTTCLEEVNKQWHCGHTFTRKCFEARSPSLYPCGKKCPKKLQCGHKCKRKCGEKCTTECKAEVERDYPCGHSMVVQCSMTPEKAPCKEMCSHELPCGHRCSGKCGECYITRLHKPCRFDVQVERFCGHMATLPCIGLSDSCSSAISISCATSHDSISWECSKVPTHCTRPCQWTCPHDAGQCSKQCHEICDRPPCSKRCEEFLRCGHRCASVCGEPCLQLCPHCQQKQFKEQLCGIPKKRKKKWVPDKHQLYIQLQCKHIFTVEFLDQYMEPKPTSDIAVCPKHCPSCKVNIRSTYRYGNILKQSLEDVASVREIVSSRVQISDEERRVLHANLRESATSLCHLRQQNALLGVLSKRAVATQAPPFPPVSFEIELMQRSESVTPEERCLAHCYINSIYLANALQTWGLNECLNRWHLFMTTFLKYTGGCRRITSLQLLLDYKMEQHRAALTLQCSVVRSQAVTCLSAASSQATVKPKASPTSESALAGAAAVEHFQEENLFRRISDKDYEKYSQLLAKVDPGSLHPGGHPLLPLELPPVIKGAWFKCRRAGHYYCRPPRMRDYPCPSCK